MRIVNVVAAAVLACALALPAAAFARDTGDSLSLDAVRSQQIEIRAGVEARSGIYQQLSPSDRNEVLSRQGRLLRMIEGKKASGELNEPDKIWLFNTLEWIEATVNQTEDDRMICEHRKVLGSHHKKRVCMTAAQRREALERAREELDQAAIQTRR
jgi:hypothetical protein